MRRVLRILLLGGRASMEQVAEIVTIHRCTFNHRMRGHGLTPHELVEEGRYNIARQLLQETDLTMVEIAAVLDYADVAVFNPRLPALFRDQAERLAGGPASLILLSVELEARGESVAI